MAETFPDVEGGIRDYLRANTGVAALVGTRVFFSIPDAPTWPLIVVREIGDTDDPSEAPIVATLIQIDCWADRRNKASANAVKRAVRAALYPIRSATALNAGTVAYGAEIVGGGFLPDPADDRPRYTLTVNVTARAA